MHILILKDCLKVPLKLFKTCYGRIEQKPCNYNLPKQTQSSMKLTDVFVVRVTSDTTNVLCKRTILFK